MPMHAAILAALQRSLRSDAASRTRRIGTRAGMLWGQARVSLPCALALQATWFRALQEAQMLRLRLLSAGRAAAQRRSRWSPPCNSLLNRFARVLACTGLRLDRPWPANATHREMPPWASTCKMLWIFESNAPRQAEQILLTAVVRRLQRTGVQEPARSLPPAADIARKCAQCLERRNLVACPAGARAEVRI